MSSCSSCGEVLAIREGWTERIRYQLTRNSPAVDMDLTGMTVDLVGNDRANLPLVFAGTIGSDDPANGIVYLDPALTDLLAAKSPYRVRWKVTDSFGKIAYFPREDPLVWNIEQP